MTPAILPPAEGGRPIRFYFFVSCALTLLCIAVYVPVVNFEFLDYDDAAYVARNPDLAQGLSVQAVKAAFSRSYLASWHPLAIVSHAVDVSLFGHRAAGHHLMNLGFHALNVLLVFLVLSKLSGRAVESAIVAALFAVHPQHVEPVAWISSRKDLLSTAIFLLALLAYHRYATRPSAGRYLAVAAFLTLGLLAKPMLVSVPFLLLLLDYWPLQRLNGGAEIRKRIAEKLPLFALCGVFALVTHRVQSAGGAVASLDLIPAGARIANAPVAYAVYLQKTLWPFQLSGFYARVPEVSLRDTALAILLLAAITVFAAVRARRNPYLAVGWGWFIITLAPVIGLIPFGYHGMADRYMYLAHIGLFTALVWGVRDLFRLRAGRAPAGILAAMVLVGVLAQSSTVYLPAWRNDITLFRRVLAIDGPHMVPLTNLGNAFQARGYYGEALDAYRAALELEPDLTELHNNVGVAEARRGGVYPAREAFARVLSENPGSASARENFATLTNAIADVETQAENLRQALAADAADAAPIMRLGNLYANAGLPAEAIALYDAAPDGALEPELLHRAYADACARGGDFEEALAHLREALRLNPDNPSHRYQNVRLLYRSGRETEASEALAALLAEQPGHVEARRYRLSMGW